MNRLMFVPVAAIVAFVAPAFAADKIDNPEYKMWSAYKAGTSVTLKSESDMAGNKSTSTMTTKLIEVGAEKLVLETVISMEVSGQKMDMPAQKRDVPAKIEKPAEQKPDEKAPKPKEGDEDIEVMGKKMKCHWTEVTSDTNGMKTVTKTWTNNDIPGNIVKSETTMSGSIAGTSKMLLVEFKPVK